MLDEVVGKVILHWFVPTFKLRMCNIADVTVFAAKKIDYASWITGRPETSLALAERS